jgi:hypothetical protein
MALARRGIEAGVTSQNVTVQPDFESPCQVAADQSQR